MYNDDIYWGFGAIEAIRNNHINLAIKIITKKNMYDINEIFRESCKNGNLKLINIIINKLNNINNAVDYFDIIRYGISGACKKKKLNVIKFIYSYAWSYGFNEYTTLRSAINNEFIECIYWLFENFEYSINDIKKIICEYISNNIYNKKILKILVTNLIININ